MPLTLLERPDKHFLLSKGKQEMFLTRTEARRLGAMLDIALYADSEQLKVMRKATGA